MNNGEYFNLPLSNYYGVIKVMKEDDFYYMALEDWDSFNKVKISEKLALLLIEEFKDKAST